MKLLPSQKNELFDIIVSNGLSPNSFSINQALENSVHIASVVVFKSSEYYFRIENRTKYGYMPIKLCPGSTLYSEARSPENWSSVLSSFRWWVQYVQREISIEDKWSRLEQEIRNADIHFKNDTDKFSAHEFEDLKSRMALLKENIKDLNLLPDQLKTIENKIDHLTELAIDLGKYDWKNLFVGTIISIIIQLGVTQENAKSLWHIIKNIFSNYFIS